MQAGQSTNSLHKKEKKERKDKTDKKEKKEKKDKLKKEKSRPAIAFHTAAQLDNFYDQGKQIGGITLGGEFYHVIKEGKRKSDGKTVVIKTIKKAPSDDPRDLLSKLRKELIVVKEISHPNVVATLDIFEDDAQFYVVTETFPEKFVLRTKMAESGVKTVVRQLCDALEYLHSKGVYSSKLELKAEKICLAGGQLKLDDVGIDQALYPTEDKLRSIGKASKSYFVAPEVLLDDSEDSLKPASDLWALGVLIFAMLSGVLPFDGESEPVLYKKVMAVNYSFPPEGISADAKAVISKLLVRDPTKRLSLAQLRAEPWLKA